MLQVLRLQVGSKMYRDTHCNYHFQVQIRSFYRVANSVFDKVGRVASEEVTLFKSLIVNVSLYCFMVLKPIR